MNEDKITLELEEIESVEIKIGKAKIRVMPYISLAEQISLANWYLETYFNVDGSSRYVDLSKRDFFGAEQSLNLALIGRMTNIDIATIDYDKFLANGVMNNIKNTIVNFYEFHTELMEMVKIIEKQYQLTDSIETLKEQFFIFVSELSSKLDAEDIKKKLQDVLEEVKNSPLEPLLKESFVNPIPKQRKNKVSKTG